VSTLHILLDHCFVSCELTVVATELFKMMKWMKLSVNKWRQRAEDEPVELSHLTPVFHW
jgi:hypothetical protein